MTGDQARALKPGDYICWLQDGAATEIGVVVGVQRFSVTIRWADGHSTEPLFNAWVRWSRLISTAGRSDASIGSGPSAPAAAICTGVDSSVPAVGAFGARAAGEFGHGPLSAATTPKGKLSIGWGWEPWRATCGRGCGLGPS